MAIDWRRLVPAIGQANRALAHYQGVLYSIPNVELLLSPLTTQEAVLSSRIEGTQATLAEVLRYEADASATDPEKQKDIVEILNYRKALREAEGWLPDKPFTLNLLLKLHAILLDSVRGRDMARGRFRRTQNWIGVAGTPIERALYVPPSPAALTDHLDNWEKYYHHIDLDPLVQLAVIHGQFEILHPFLDGNGRLGRILIPLFLYERKLLARPTFYLSEWLEEHRDQYVGALRNLSGADGEAWNQWIAFFLAGITEQAGRNAGKARAIIELYESLKGRVIELTHSTHAVPLLDELFRRPTFKSTDIRLVPQASKATIAKLVRAMEAGGIVKVTRGGVGNRPAVYTFTELLDICDAPKTVATKKTRARAKR